VPVNDPGYCFLITFSVAFGVSSWNGSERAVSGVKTGAPAGVWWTMCTRGADAERYLERREVMTARVEATFSVFS